MDPITGKHREGLEEQRRRLNHRIQRLSRNSAGATNPAYQDELEQQIADAEEELIRITEQLDVINQTPLYEALLRLNFHDQIQSSRLCLETHGCGLFLIHGEPDHGQDWVLHRLIRKAIPRAGYTSPIEIDLGRRSRGINLDDVWRELYCQHRFYDNIEVSQLADRFYERWKTQSVILIINGASQI